MTEIPADVMKAARETFHNLITPGNDSSDSYAGDDITTIARAIMAEQQRFVMDFDGAADAGIDAAIAAERERCARIVRFAKAVSGEPGMQTVRPLTLDEIAKRIESGK